jgi:hypothetical protein
MAKVQGNDMIIWVFDDPTFKPVACSTTCTFEVTSDMDEKTTIGTGVWKQSRYDRLSWQISGENLILLNDATKFTAIGLLEAQMNFLDLLVQFSMTDGPVDKVFTGRVLVQSNVLTGPVNEFAKHQFVLQGTGSFVISNDFEIPIITIEVTGVGTGQIDSLQLTDPSGLTGPWLLTGPFVVGTTNTWVLDGLGGNPPSGSYYLEAVVTTSEATNHFSTDALPTFNIGVSSPGATLNTAPLGTSVLYDFTTARNITFLVGS